MLGIVVGSEGEWVGLQVGGRYFVACRWVVCCFAVLKGASEKSGSATKLKIVQKVENRLNWCVSHGKRLPNVFNEWKEAKNR